MLTFPIVNRSYGSGGQRRFAFYAWLVLAYNILVILWGAVVRATGSGAGCGDHWPLCEGQVIPHAAQIATLIEFAHRATSGIAVVLVLGLIYFAFRLYSKGRAARRYASAALFFTVTEGLLGAALVLTESVGGNASLTRVGILSLHLVNTFLLLAALALTAKTAGEAPSDQPALPAGRSGGAALPAAFAAGLLGTLAIAVTGTIAALADTLFPAQSLAQGMQLDFSGASNIILRLRIIHPAVAVVVGGFLLILAAYVMATGPGTAARRISGWMLGLVLLQFCFGIMNLVLLAPVWMQVLHLLAADLIWVTLVLLTGEVLLKQPAPVARPAVPSMPAVETPIGKGL